MTRYSTLFIINPAAGHGRAARLWASIKEEALRLLPASGCVVTERPKHAAELAHTAVERGVVRLIAVGGDGTFCETLEGLMNVPDYHRRGVELGALPAGSGCDLARHLGYPADRAGLLKLLARGKARPLDVGRLSYTGVDGAPLMRYFINIAAFGLAGEVARLVQRLGKPLGGTASYAAASALALLGAKAAAVRLKADGKDLSGRYHLGVLANTSSMGGGMRIAPGATDDDGLMDLVLVADMSRAALAANLPRLYRGTHLAAPGVSLTPLRRLEADSDETVYLNVDGEADGRLPAVFEVLPRAVKVITPVKL